MKQVKPFKQIFYETGDGQKLYFFQGKRGVMSWQNFGMPDFNFIEDSGPNQHGTTVRDYRAQTRTITLELFGENCDGRQCEYAEIIEAIRPTRDVTPGYLRVINQDTSLLEIPAWIQSGPSGSFSQDSGLSPKQIRDVLQFHCNDPIWRRVGLITNSVTVQVASSCLDMCLPACLGTDLLAGTLEICYNGSWPGDQIIITIVGPVDAPLITNVTTGKTIQLNYNVASNDIVTISIFPEQVTIESSINGNIIGTVTNVSDLVFFTLKPRQINIINITGVNAVEGSSAVNVSYYERYLSVYDSCIEVC